MLAAATAAGAFAAMSPSFGFGFPPPVLAPSSPGPVNRALFGTNYDIYNYTRESNSAVRQLWPSVAARSQQMNLQFVRMDPAVNLQYCGGVDCTYHWMQSTPGSYDYRPGVYATKLSPDQWMQQVGAVAAKNATPMIVVNIEAGTVAEAQDWVAYMNGLSTSTTILGDGSSVAHWANVRAANGHPAPYGVKYWEMGNEEHGLHACILGSDKNKAGCSNNTPADCLIYNTVNLYGCIISDYGRAMKAVDPNIAIVVGYDGTDYSAVKAKAGGLISALDLHEYPDANIETYGTAFDTDNQRADYTVSYSTSGGLQAITFGLWMSAAAPGHIDVYLDHSAVAMKSYSISPSSAAIPYPVNMNEALGGFHQHVLTVVACSNNSTNMLTGTCQPDGRHAQVYLQHITVSKGNLMQTTMNSEAGCFLGSSGIPQTTVADTSVTTTSGHTGGGAPGTPWRLGATTDFPIAFAAGTATVFGPQVPNQFSKLYYWRKNMAASGFSSIPLIVGEYATWAGCDEQPLDLASTQIAGVWTALVTSVMYSDTNAAYPIIGAATYTLDGGGPNQACTGFHLLTSVLTNGKPCQGSDTGYLSPTGLALAQFASLSGNRAATTVTGGPLMVSYPAGTQAEIGVPGITAVASHTGTSTTVVLVNACPASGQCGAGPVTVSVKLQSASALTSASATTVAAPSALSDNTDAAPTTVSQQPLAASVSGGTATVTLAPLSVTTLTIGT